MRYRVSGVPLVEADHVLSAGEVSVTVRRNQPVVWVRLVPWVGPDRPRAVCFPAVIDTGNNHSFLIPGPLFRTWADADDHSPTSGRHVIVNGIPLGCHPFNLELSQVRRGEPTRTAVARLQTDQGVTVIPDALTASFPRLPVLGVRCLTVNRLTFTLNGGRRSFSLTQPGR